MAHRITMHNLEIWEPLLHYLEYAVEKTAGVFKIHLALYEYRDSNIRIVFTDVSDMFIRQILNPALGTFGLRPRASWGCGRILIVKHSVAFQNSLLRPSNTERRGDTLIVPGNIFLEYLQSLSAMAVTCNATVGRYSDNENV